MNFLGRDIASYVQLPKLIGPFDCSRVAIDLKVKNWKCVFVDSYLSLINANGFLHRMCLMVEMRRRRYAGTGVVLSLRGFATNCDREKKSGELMKLIRPSPPKSTK